MTDQSDPADAPNEIVAAARDASAKREAAARAEKKSWPIAQIGFGLGIGSAAIAAAVLYSNRSRTRR